MKNLSFIAFLIALLFMTCQCKDDDIDMCADVYPTSADFYIYPNLGVNLNFWKDVDTDTVSYSNGAIFTSKQEADEYIWTIGSETITEQSFVRTDFPRDQNITVSLKTINYSPNTECFPDDNGEAFFSRTFFAADTTIKKSRWNGTYIGTYEFSPDESHQFTLHIDSFEIQGLPFSECRHTFEQFGGTYNSLLFRIRDQTDQEGRCGEPAYAGFFHLDTSQDSFYIEINSSVDSEIDKKFMRGVKIN